MRHVGIVVKNLNRSIEFYKHLGFHPMQGSVEEWDGCKLSIMKMNSLGGVLELVEGLWIPHVSVTVNQLDELSWGSKITDRPNARVCFIQDQDHNWVELVEEK